MKKYLIIHIPHSSLYIPNEYRKTSLLEKNELDIENEFMCDMHVDKLVNNKNQTIIFKYSRLYCDVERFRDDSEVMNKYGMGYIYTKTSLGKDMFKPSVRDRNKIDKIYDEHHDLFDERVSKILDKYKKCIIIDLHSYSDELVYRLFGYNDAPDICLGVEENYYSKEIVDYITKSFNKFGYSVKINYPYSGSFVPNRFYNKVNTGIVSVMIEINKRVYINDLDKFKKILNNILDNIE